MIEIVQSVTPFSEQCSTTVPGQLPMARAHERDPVKDSTAGIKGLLVVFLSRISMHLSTVQHRKWLNRDN